MTSRLMRRAGALVLCVMLALPLVVQAVAADTDSGSAVAAAQSKPNFVLIVLDDLSVAALDAALPRMPAITAMREHGVTFSRFFATTPLCCPSRASILRGQYAHNHGVLRNSKQGRKPGGFTTFYELGHEQSTVATWLQDAGYRTALFGKYLNQYPEGAAPGHWPPGWDEWYAKPRGHYFNYLLNENGEAVPYGSRPVDYEADVLAAKAADFIERAAAADRPFFVYLAPQAPHNPAIAAPRHAAAFAGALAPRSPSFNEADVGDKPGWVRNAPELSDAAIVAVDERHRAQMRTLLAIDDMVATLVAALDASDTLDETYIFFTSDNGTHHGTHRLPGGKSDPYEESIRVPLIVRAPNAAPGRVEDRLALNIDLAPTIAALAGTEPPDFVDGRSLAALLRGDDAEALAWRHAVLIEIFGGNARLNPGPGKPAKEGRPAEAAPPFTALRTTDLLYVEYGTGERELYDLAADPHQLANQAATADPALLALLSERLAQLRDCAEAACQAAEDAPLDLPVPGAG